MFGHQIIEFELVTDFIASFPNWIRQLQLDLFKLYPIGNAVFLSIPRISLLTERIYSY